MSEPGKLFVDARWTRVDAPDGITRFTANLVERLHRVRPVTMLVHDERQLSALPEGVPHVLVNSPFSPRELVLSRTLHRLGADVVFSPLQVIGGFRRRYKLILTLHDLIYYRHPCPPGFLPLPVRILWRLYHLAYWPQRILLDRADAVVTVSETTKGLIERHRLTSRPVWVVPNAPAQPSEPAESDTGGDDIAGVDTTGLGATGNGVTGGGASGGSPGRFQPTPEHGEPGATPNDASGTGAITDNVVGGGAAEDGTTENGATENGATEDGAAGTDTTGGDATGGGRDLVYMGAFLPHKNVETLIAGMAWLPGYRLHLLSPITPARESELAGLAPPGSEIVFWRGIEERDYQRLLRRAAALVTASHDEGFGIPVIEAMNAGAPVACSDLGIFREVTGGHAVFFDPTSAERFAAAVRRLEDAELRQALISAGREHAAMYSWEASADRLLELVRRLEGADRRLVP